MFKNIGEKIKNLVTLTFAIIVIIAVLIFLTSLGSNEEFIAIMFFSCAGVVLLAWVSSFVLYGFGELVDNIQKQTKQNETIIKLMRKESESTNEEVIRENTENRNDTEPVHIY